MIERRVYLLGFMGAGKSTVGRMLSEQLDWPFVDLDQLIERRARMSIPEYFRTRGESSFRQLELQCLDRVSRRQPPVVVACGGGTPLSTRNRRIMEETGFPILLSITPETAIRRVGDDPDRPLFQDPEQVRELWQRRRSAYEDIPQSVNANDRSAAQVTEAILEKLRNETARSGS